MLETSFTPFTHPLFSKWDGFWEAFELLPLKALGKWQVILAFFVPPYYACTMNLGHNIWSSHGSCMHIGNIHKWLEVLKQLNNYYHPVVLIRLVSGKIGISLTKNNILVDRCVILFFYIRGSADLILISGLNKVFIIACYLRAHTFKYNYFTNLVGMVSQILQKTLNRLSFDKPLRNRYWPVLFST